VSASLNVTNTGTRDGAETVQIYATPPSPGAAARLVGWSKISLKPGESRTIVIAAEPRLLAHFDREANVWRIASGEYTISARTSVTDIKASTVVTLAERTIKP
jgi:beta-glucosidase